MGTMKLLFVLLLLVPGSVLAQPIVINEIAWMGTPVDGVAQNQWWRYEWLELFNTTDVPVSLNGWFIELRRESLDFTIRLAGGIPAKGYFLVVSSGKISQSNTNYANLGGKFFNEGQQVLLKNSSGVVQDEIDAKEGWPAGDNETKRTMERIDPLRAGFDASNWKTSEAVGGSPRQENSKRSLPLANKKADPSFGSAPLVPSHFIAAVLVALAAVLAVMLLRRFLKRFDPAQRKRANSFGGPEH